MRALLKAYFILYAVACMGLAMLIYVYFVLGCKETSLCYHVCGNVRFLDKITHLYFSDRLHLFADLQYVLRDIFDDLFSAAKVYDVKRSMLLLEKAEAS